MKKKVLLNLLFVSCFNCTWAQSIKVINTTTKPVTLLIQGIILDQVHPMHRREFEDLATGQISYKYIKGELNIDTHYPVTSATTLLMQIDFCETEYRFDTRSYPSEDLVGKFISTIQISQPLRLRGGRPLEDWLDILLEFDICTNRKLIPPVNLNWTPNKTYWQK